MEYDKLTSLYRLFDEISLLRNNGIKGRSEGDWTCCDCGLRASGMAIYITADD